MRGVSKYLIDAVLAHQPKAVEFEIEPPLTSCVIETNEEKVEGMAICSVLDRFDEKTGKNKALGRAIKALNRKESSGIVREYFDDYPDSWTKRQIMNVIGYGGVHKSFYLQ